MYKSCLVYAMIKISYFSHNSLGHGKNHQVIRTLIGGGELAMWQMERPPMRCWDLLVAVVVTGWCGGWCRGQKKPSMSHKDLLVVVVGCMVGADISKIRNLS